MTNYMSLTDNPSAPPQYWNPSRTCYVDVPHFPFKLLSSVWFMSGASVFTGCTTNTKCDSSSSVSSRRQPQRHHVTRHPESTSDNHGNGTAALGEISSKSLSDLQLLQGKHWNIIGPPQVTWCRCCSILLQRLRPCMKLFSLLPRRHYSFCSNASVREDYLSAWFRQWH